jgi:O-methyltransferase
MNLIKLVSPDFFLGKTLSFIRAMLDLAWLLLRKPSKQALRFAWLTLRLIPAYTMVTPSRLINLYQLVKDANARKLPGDIVECGVWNGGSAAIMGIACQEDKIAANDREMWLFDSFQGLPRPGERDGKIERDLYFGGWNKGDAEKVKKIFAKLNIPLNKTRIIPGWFDVTLANAPVNAIAVLHIDADWYDSVKVVLESLYDKVVPGGFIILDDYGTWQGCKKALADYFREQGIDGVIIKPIDGRGAYFQKPG